MQHFVPIGELKLKLQSGNAQFGSKSTIFLAVWPRNLTLKWPWKTIGHLFYATSSFVHHFVPIGEFKLELQSGNAQFGSNWMIFRAVRPWNLTDDLEKQYGTSSMLLQALCSISYPLVKSNWSYSPETPILGQIRRFLARCDLETWQMTLKNNRAPLLSNIKLYVSFHHHMWIQTGVTVRKRLSWVATSVTLTFDLWPSPFAWTLPWSVVITLENFMMIRWWEHSQKGVTDRQTDGQTDRQTENTIHRAAWSQLKTRSMENYRKAQDIRKATEEQNFEKHV